MEKLKEKKLIKSKAVENAFLDVIDQLLEVANLRANDKLTKKDLEQNEADQKSCIDRLIQK